MPVPIDLRAALLCAALPAVAAAQTFPARPVRVIVPFTAGSAIDAAARIMAARQSELWKQQVVVDNRVGANTMIGVEAVAKAPADGHTLGTPNDASLAVNPALYPKVPYDPTRDFAPIVQIASIALVLITHPSFPARNVKELVAVARARPGEINYATGGTGSAQHIPMEMLMVATGTKLAHVPYKGLTPALNDIVGGQIPVMFAGMAGALPHIRTSRVRVLAVSGGKRSGVLPEVPTVAESGIAGFDYSAWFGYVAPAGTPRDVVARLNADIAKSANHPDTVEKLVGLGFEMSTGTPEQFAAYIRSEMTRIGELVRRTGMRAE